MFLHAVSTDKACIVMFPRMGNLEYHPVTKLRGGHYLEKNTCRCGKSTWIYDLKKISYGFSHEKISAMKRCSK